MEEDPPIGIPEWVVTFGDMMSLLLTFFIMLVSMSEMKQDEKYQAVASSIEKQFGHDRSTESVSPGKHTPKESAPAGFVDHGPREEVGYAQGWHSTQAPVGDNERVRIVRPGGNTAIGTVVFFEDGELELNDDAKTSLDEQVKLLSGKPQKIEVRGHTSQQLASQGAIPLDAMDLGYRRCRNVMLYLTEKHGIPSERIRLSTAGSGEPMYLSSDPDKTRLNPRVEVFLLEETVDQLIGTAQERDDQVLETQPVTE